MTDICFQKCRLKHFISQSSPNIITLSGWQRQISFDAIQSERPKNCKFGNKYHLNETRRQRPGACFTNVSRALQDILLKFVYCRNRCSCENFKLKLCMCAQSMALGTRISFSLKFSPQMWFPVLCIFERLFWRARKTLVKQPPEPPHPELHVKVSHL